MATRDGLRPNRALVLAGVLCGLGALLHVLVICGGAQWYRFFGAGEEMAALAERGSPIPTIVTSGIVLVLSAWTLYAFSGAGMVRRLPLAKPCLVLAAAIFLVRGLAPWPVFLIRPALATPLMIWSSVYCAILGCAFAVGARQVWRRL